MQNNSNIPENSLSLCPSVFRLATPYLQSIVSDIPGWQYYLAFLPASLLSSCCSAFSSTLSPQLIFCQHLTMQILKYHQHSKSLLGASSFLNIYYIFIWASPIAQLVKNPPAMQETPVPFLGQKDQLEKG